MAGEPSPDEPPEPVPTVRRVGGRMQAEQPQCAGGQPRFDQVALLCFPRCFANSEQDKHRA